MLDLNFVREHLSLVEEKLRLRGMNPEEVLGDFRAADAERRANITTLETAKQRRNELSPKIGVLKQAELSRITALLRSSVLVRVDHGHRAKE